MGDGRWEMGDGRWEMGDGRWEMGDELADYALRREQAGECTASLSDAHWGTQ